MKIDKRSMVSGDSYRVSIDPFELNPLAQDYAQVNPGNFNNSTYRAGPPPKMFAAGTQDLPAFTASGSPRKFMQSPMKSDRIVSTT